MNGPLRSRQRWHVRKPNTSHNKMCLGCRRTRPLPATDEATNLTSQGSACPALPHLKATPGQAMGTCQGNQAQATGSLVLHDFRVATG